MSDYKKLLKSDNFLNFLINRTFSAIFVVDKEMHIVFFNKAFEKLFGACETATGELFGNVMGCNYSSDVKAECGSALDCHDCEMLKSIITAFNEKNSDFSNILDREFVINGRKSRKFIRFNTLYYSQKQTELAIVIAEDITQYKACFIQLEKKNKELQKLHELKNDLLGIAANEMRNPLSSINSFSTLLIDSLYEFTPNEIKDYLKTIQESSSVTLSQLDNILDYAKIDELPLILKKEKTDYPGFVKQYAGMNSAFARNKNISLISSIGKNLPLIWIDRNKIGQVLNHLFNNAVKFSSSGTAVIIEVKMSGNEILTKITDHGQMIEQEELEHIFELRKKAGLPFESSKRGTGMGLAICWRIIAGHNGTISVYSSPGEETSFYFTLPVIKTNS